MPTQKRIDGDYVITTINPPDDVVINTNTLVVNGNLDVMGNLTYINVDELSIRDPFILLNSSNTSTYASNSGILTHETASTFAGIRYNATAGAWQLSIATDSTGLTGTWNNIGTSGSGVPVGPNESLQYNDGGNFGGDAALTFDVANAAVILQGHQVFGNIGTAPGATANAVTVFHNAVAEGDSGLYVQSAAGTDELITKQRAVFYSLIF
jgi:hypothetical protein